MVYSFVTRTIRLGSAVGIRKKCPDVGFGELSTKKVRSTFFVRFRWVDEEKTSSVSLDFDPRRVDVENRRTADFARSYGITAG